MYGTVTAVRERCTRCFKEGGWFRRANLVCTEGSRFPSKPRWDAVIGHQNRLRRNPNRRKFLYTGGVLAVCVVKFMYFGEMYVTNTDHVVLVVLIIRTFMLFCSDFVVSLFHSGPKVSVISFGFGRASNGG